MLAKSRFKNIATIISVFFFYILLKYRCDNSTKEVNTKIQDLSKHTSTRQMDLQVSISSRAILYLISYIKGSATIGNLNVRFNS